MRAARLHELGGVPQIDEIDPPSAEAVRASAGALNPVDISIGSGRFHGGTPPMPYIVGSEVVGTTPDGRRVWVRGRELLSELVDPVTALWVFDIPEGVSDDAALAAGIAGLTAWLAVTWRAPVQPDDTVLVLGASGALGSVAVQAAKLLGAARVIGAARRADLVPDAADEVFDLSADGPAPEATLIVDALWGEPIERALAAAAQGVRVVHLGQSAGPVARLESGWVRGKGAAILGHSLVSHTPEDVAGAGYPTLAAHIRDGEIKVDTESYPLDEIAEAWRRQASGSPGSKLLLAF
jgi:NADPH2:quinone reductase